MRKYFPKENKFNKLFNKNNIKISYGCTRNMFTFCVAIVDFCVELLSAISSGELMTLNYHPSRGCSHLVLFSQSS